MASLEHVFQIGKILETDKITKIIAFFTENMEFEGAYKAANIESMLELAEIEVEIPSIVRPGQYELSIYRIGLSQISSFT